MSFSINISGHIQGDQGKVKECEAKVLEIMENAATEIADVIYNAPAGSYAKGYMVGVHIGRNDFLDEPHDSMTADGSSNGEMH